MRSACRIFEASRLPTRFLRIPLRKKRGKNTNPFDSSQSRCACHGQSALAKCVHQRPAVAIGFFWTVVWWVVRAIVPSRYTFTTIIIRWFEYACNDLAARLVRGRTDMSSSGDCHWFEAWFHLAWSLWWWFSVRAVRGIIHLMLNASNEMPTFRR